MNVQAVAQALRIVWPYLAKHVFKRKINAAVGLSALAAGQVWPEIDPIATVIAASCLTGNALRAIDRKLPK